MKVLLLGGAGRLARMLAGDLARCGVMPILAPRQEVDATSIREVHGALVELAPQVVVNCAAWTDVRGCERDPARSDTANRRTMAVVADAARRCGVPCLCLSTDYARAPLVYGADKLRGEGEAVAAGACVVRLALLHREDAARYTWLNGATRSCRLWADDAATRLARFIVGCGSEQWAGQVVALGDEPTTVARMVVADRPTDDRPVVTDSVEVSRRLGFLAPADTTWPPGMEVVG